jgi:hypothetical protein
MNPTETDNKFNRIIDILIDLVTESSLLVGMKLVLQLIVVGIPVVTITLILQVIIRFLDWILLSYQLIIRRESRKKAVLWLFLKRIK